MTWPETTVPLPGPTERVGCASYTAGLGVDPGGSAIRADLLVAVETPLPWPKPVHDHPLLGGLAEIARSAPCPTRILSAVPRREGELHVVAYRRYRTDVGRGEWVVDPGSLLATVGAMVDGELGPTVTNDDLHPPNPELWICTQGSHDVCCGAEGSRLAGLVEATMPDVVVRRVSHTGGHRFAPTGLTLPDGRMWGGLSPALVDRIIARAEPTALLAEHCRGWWGAGEGREQMAERAVWSERGWDWPGGHVTTVFERGHESLHTVEGKTASGRVVRYEVGVTLRRAVPTIACRAPGGLPAKPGQEYAVTSVDPVQ